MAAGKDWKDKVHFPKGNLLITVVSMKTFAHFAQKGHNSSAKHHFWVIKIYANKVHEDTMKNSQ